MVLFFCVLWPPLFFILLPQKLKPLIAFCYLPTGLSFSNLGTLCHARFLAVMPCYGLSMAPLYDRTFPSYVLDPHL